VADEDAYRRKGEEWQESREISNELEAIQTKMEVLVPNKSEREVISEHVFHTEINTDTNITQLENKIKQLEDEEQRLYEKLADVNFQKERLEEGGTYAELVHQLAQRKDHFRAEAKKWSVYCTAEPLLEKAKERYRSEKMPKVIDTASQYFSKMTKDRYSSIFAPAEKGFIVERADGRRFSPAELSRGTVEQLYLSIRLALAMIYQSSSPYPIIMDDILVNFDSER